MVEVSSEAHVLVRESSCVLEFFTELLFPFGRLSEPCPLSLGNAFICRNQDLFAET